MYYEATVGCIQHGKQRGGGCMGLLEPNDAEQTGCTFGGGGQNTSWEVQKQAGKDRQSVAGGER